MIKLINILKETIKQYDDIVIPNSVINNLISRDSPKIYKDSNNTQYSRNGQLSNINIPFYDFGGAENYISSPNNVVVDYNENNAWSEEDIKNFSKEGEWENFINADLSKSIKLPPRKAINMSWSLGWIISPGNASTIADNINNALTPGGILLLTDHLNSIIMLLKKLPSFKLLEINLIDYGGENNSEYTPEEIKQMKKDGTLTPDIIENFLNNTATVVLQK